MKIEKGQMRRMNGEEGERAWNHYSLKAGHTNLRVVFYFAQLPPPSGGGNQNPN
ncbi:MAG: hypothetical protein WAN36_16670 [Calditrichia bacterium]